MWHAQGWSNARHTNSVEWSRTLNVCCNMNIHEFRRELKETRSFLESYFESFAGDDLPEMLSTKSAAQAFVTHPNKDRRVAALFVLTYRWPHDQTTADAFLAAAVSDDDVEVRALAVGFLPRIYSTTGNDKSIPRFLAHQIVRENIDIRIRENAYRALCEIAELPVWEHPPLLGFIFLRDVNWGFVSRFLE